MKYAYDIGECQTKKEVGKMEEIKVIPEHSAPRHGWLLEVDTAGVVSRYPFDPEKCLEQLQAIVGGHLELVTLEGGLSRYDGFCNDEGKLERLPVNGVMSSVYGRDLICGNVAICKHDAQGDTLGLTDDDIFDICNFLAQVGASVDNI